MTKKPAKKSGPAEGRDRNKATRSGIDVKMLEMLVCPQTRTALQYDAKNNELVSNAARLAFPIRDGVPVMLASEARQLSDEEVAKG